jgi:ABC-type branched-subunit amino acid transport system substrate-binding protein
VGVAAVALATLAAEVPKRHYFRSASPEHMPINPRLGPRSAVLAFLIGCGQAAPVRIGDGYPRDESLPFLEAIRPAVESAGVLISTWSVGGDPRITIQLNTEQASLFADDPTVAAVVGHTGSREALLASVIYNAREVPHVVPNATSGLLGQAGPWTFTLVPSDSVEGAFIANYALDSLGASRIGVLYLGDEYGIGLRDGVRAALRRRGTDFVDASMIPSDWCYAEPAASIHRAIINASLRRAQPDVVVVTTGSSSGWCTADLIHATNPEAWIIFGDGMDGARHVPDLTPRVNPGRIRGVEFWVAGTDSMSRAFVDRVQHKLGRPPEASHALQHDAYMLLATAIREAGPDRRAIRRWLESLGRSRDPWRGLTGPIAFNRPRSELLRMGGPESRP